jgi:DNA-binding MarR family transcriptional regulator
VNAPDQSPGDARLAAAPSTDTLDRTLRSFQLLQMHTSHTTSRVSSSLGIGASELRLLLYIASSGGITPKLAGDFLELTSGTITSLVDRMVAAGLVERVPNPDDRRSLILELAPDGSAAVERVVGIYRRAFSASIAPQNMKLLATSFATFGESLSTIAAEELADDTDD